MHFVYFLKRIILACIFRYILKCLYDTYFIFTSQDLVGSYNIFNSEYCLANNSLKKN